MAYQLLKLYKTELSLKQIMIKKMKWRNYYKSIISLLLFALTAIIFKSIFVSFWTNTVFLLIIPWIILFLKDANKERDRIIDQENGGKDYYTIRTEGVRRFLMSKGIDSSPHKIDLLIKMVEKQSDERKVSFFVGRGVLLAIFIPMFSATYNNILNKHVDRLETAIVILIIMISILIVILYFISIFKLFYDEFVNGDYQIYKTISNDLRELYFKVA